MIKYTREELEKMPLKVIRNLDIKTIEDEKLIQEIVDKKTVVLPPVIKFDYRNVPDIKNGEQEKVWQDKINKFNDDHRIDPLKTQIQEAEKIFETIKDEIKFEKPIAIPTVVLVDKGEIIKPFCDKCTSKGVRHKKECPTLKQNADISSNPIQ